MAGGAWNYAKVEGVTKRLTGQEPQLVVRRWWPDGVKVRADFAATDTANFFIALFKSTKVDPDTISPESGIIKWPLRGARSFSKQFETEAGVWFFIAGRPRTNWFDPEAKIEVFELHFEVQHTS